MGSSFILAVFGFGGLALAMGRHHRDLLGTVPSWARSSALRVLGSFLLAMSYVLLCAKLGATEGTIEWLGLASVAAIAIALCLTIALLLRAPAERSGTSNPNGIAQPAPPDRSTKS